MSGSVVHLGAEKTVLDEITREFIDDAAKEMGVVPGQKVGVMVAWPTSHPALPPDRPTARPPGHPAALFGV